ncbi:uncharacterized protein LOC128240341 [Mya arenaria]|uniref:uncharacterized protein LOC128240341 n=1 Tax=Mya arenaria TaxID=6604 RepID=UPI0022E2B80F|nr:uncharacterized protein LOC128240341 [Mya arenaria]
MSQQIRAAQLLRKAANLLQSPVTTVSSTVPPSTGTTSTSSTPAVQAIRSLFGPYNRRSYGRRGGRVGQPEKDNRCHIGHISLLSFPDANRKRYQTGKKNMGCTPCDLARSV